jgi:hypothetical protein
MLPSLYTDKLLPIGSTVLIKENGLSADFNEYNGKTAVISDYWNKDNNRSVPYPYVLTINGKRVAYFSREKLELLELVVVNNKKNEDETNILLAANILLANILLEAYKKNTITETVAGIHDALRVLGYRINAETKTNYTLVKLY